MSFAVPPIGPTPPSNSQAARVGGSAPAGGVGPAVEVALDVPASPPEQLYAEMANASRRVDELREQGRELHFSTEPETGRIVIEVRDLNGHVIRTIPPSKLLEVAGGAPLDD